MVSAGAGARLLQPEGADRTPEARVERQILTQWVWWGFKPAGSQVTHITSRAPEDRFPRSFQLPYWKWCRHGD